MKKGEKVALGAGVAGLAALTIWALTKKVEEAPPPKVYECPYCGAEFATEGELLAHIQAEHPEQPLVYVCPYCGATFATEEELADHIALEHPPAAYKCPYCGAAFNTEEELANHVALEHPLEPYIVCPDCEVAFYWDETPPFTVNESHIGHVYLKNLASYQLSNYIVQLNVGANNVSKLFSLAPLESKIIEISILMPSIEGTYLVYLNLFNELKEHVGQYKAEHMTLIKAAFITIMLPGPQPTIPIETGPLPEPQPPAGAHPLMISVYGQTNFKPCMTTMTGVPRWTTWRIVFSPPGGGWLTVYVGNYYYEAVNIYYIDPHQVPPVEFVDYLVNVTAVESSVGEIDMGGWYSVRLKPGANRIDIKFPQE